MKDKKQFFEGLQLLGFNSINYCNEEELKELYLEIDNNNSDCITIGEFSNFIEKRDLSGIKGKIKKERELKESDEHFNRFSHIDSKFISANFDDKLYLINLMIEKIQDFYSVLNNDINFTDVNQLIKLIDEKINISDVDIHFPSSIIFYQQFNKFIKKFKVDINDDDIKKVFYYFDQNNKNLFIYTQNLKRYLHERPKKKKKKKKRK